MRDCRKELRRLALAAISVGLASFGVTSSAWTADSPLQFELTIGSSGLKDVTIKGTIPEGQETVLQNINEQGVTLHLWSSLDRGHVSISGTIATSFMSPGSFSYSGNLPLAPYSFKTTGGSTDSYRGNLVLIWNGPAIESAEPKPTEQSAQAPAPDLPSLDPIDDTYAAIGTAKVRERPDVEAKSVAELKAGDKVTVLGQVKGQDWYAVERDGKRLGYVVTRFLVPEAEFEQQVRKQSAPPAKQGLPPELAGIDFGRYYALVIGNNVYEKLPRLETAVADAKAVAAALQRDYGFTVTLLTDSSRRETLAALYALRKLLTANDNLLIYYAGHGTIDGDTRRGYWLPVDADSDFNDPADWISNDDVTNALDAMDARHVLVIADSCYSGTLTRGGTRTPGSLRKISGLRSRTVLTSGGFEPVSDAGAEGHSVFAKAFLDALADNTTVIDGQSLFIQLRGQVVNNADQGPEYGNIRLTNGYTDGDFIFVRR